MAARAGCNDGTRGQGAVRCERLAQLGRTRARSAPLAGSRRKSFVLRGLSGSAVRTPSPRGSLNVNRGCADRTPHCDFLGTSEKSAATAVTSGATTVASPWRCLPHPPRPHRNGNRHAKHNSDDANGHARADVDPFTATIATSSSTTLGARSDAIACKRRPPS